MNMITLQHLLITPNHPLVLALKEEFNFLGGDDESWVKAAQGVADKMKRYNHFVVQMELKVEGGSDAQQDTDRRT
jgi:hypothetical protein